MTLGFMERCARSRESACKLRWILPDPLTNSGSVTTQSRSPAGYLYGGAGLVRRCVIPPRIALLPA